MLELIRDPFARRLFAEAREGVAVFDADGALVAWNAAARAITGWDQAAASTHDLLAIGAGMLEIRAGKWVDVRRSTVDVGSGALQIMLFADSTPQYALSQARRDLTAGGLIDGVTKLAGRDMLMGHLERSISLAERDSRAVGVLSIGIDIPRVAEQVPIDELMHQLGQRVFAAMRGSDLAARVSERELVVVLTAMSDWRDASVVSVRMLLKLSQPYVLVGRERSVTISVGVASFPTHGATATTVLDAAALAMSRVRAGGGGYNIAA
jgi:diguanylate cyclase (GGDEF)-like protein